MNAAQIDRDLKTLQGIAQRLIPHLDDLSVPQMNILTAALLDIAPAYQYLPPPQITERLPNIASQLVVENQRSKALLEAIFNTAPAGLAVVTGDTLEFAYVNPVYRFACPIPETNLIGLPYAEVWANDPASCFVEPILRTLKTGKPFQTLDFERRFPGGSTRTFVFQARRMQWDDQHAVLLVLWDITERKRVEEALEKSEKKYQDLIRYAPAGIYEIDFRKKRFTSVNDKMCQITGYSREELLEMNPFEILDEQGRALLQERITRWLTGEKPDENITYWVWAKDGHAIRALLNVTFIADESGKPLGATVVGFDITER